MTFQPQYQQPLEPVLGHDRALQACLPTCFYMSARAYGYLPEAEFVAFSSEIDWNSARNADGSWLRPKLSHELRRRYRIPVVSWWINGHSPQTEADWQRMIDAGYVETQREVEWLKRNVLDWPLEVIVAAGTPVIATMKPGFGPNKSVHAVILAALENDRYEVLDPDARNKRKHYSIDEIRRNLRPAGAGSVILPPLHS